MRFFRIDNIMDLGQVFRGPIKGTNELDQLGFCSSLRTRHKLLHSIRTPPDQLLELSSGFGPVHGRKKLFGAATANAGLGGMRDCRGLGARDKGAVARVEGGMGTCARCGEARVPGPREARNARKKRACVVPRVSLSVGRVAS